MSDEALAPAPTGAARPHAVLHRWPTVLGLGAAATLLATGADRDTLAVMVGVAALCYLAAAALAMPWIAWAGIVGGSLVVAVSELLGLAWWAGIGIVTVVLVGIGLLGRARLPALTVQTAALLGFGGLAVASLFVAPRAGLFLAAGVLAVHAVWDVIHFRRAEVVPRSPAEFCMMLDVLLGVGLAVLAVAA